MNRTGPGSESATQQAVIVWWAYAWRGLGVRDEARLFAVPNGGHRSKKTAAIMKAEGVRRGVADLLLLVPRAGFHGLAIEMKKKKGGRVTPEQAAFLHSLAADGYACKVCFTFDEARATIEGYCRLSR